MLPSMGKAGELGSRDHAVEAAIPTASRPAVARPIDPVKRMTRAVGNRAFTALVARAGEGVLPDGSVHPNVDAAIASARGRGSPLDAPSRELFGSHLGDPLRDVRVHTDDHADELAHAVSARAFTTGSDVFFARGEYRPGSSEGNRLIAHELAHVVQQRGAPTTGPLVVSEPGEPLEREAEAIASELTG